MKDSLCKLDVERKTGCERFHARGSDTNFDLLGFWQWSMSDLVTNTSRGILAEYIGLKHSVYPPRRLAMPGHLMTLSHLTE